MADLIVDGEDLVVRLTDVEKAESLHHDVRVPRRAVRTAEALDEPVKAVEGWKVVGARLSGVFAIGLFSADGHKSFAVVHHGTARGVRVRLEGTTYDELIVGCEDPGRVVASLRTEEAS